MHWLWFALLFGLAQATYFVCVKYAGNSIAPHIGIVITNTIAFIGAFVVYFLFKQMGAEMTLTKSGAWWMVGAGVMIVLFELAFYWLFYVNAPMVSAITVTRALPLVLIALYGFIILGEQFTLQKLTGVVLALASVYLITTAK